MKTLKEMKLELEAKPVKLTVVRKIDAGNVLEVSGTLTKIKTQADETDVAKVRDTIHTFIKVVNDRRLSITRVEYDQPKKEFMQAVAEKLADFVKEDDRLTTLLLNYRAEQRRKEAAAEAERQRKIAEAEAKAKAEEERRIAISKAKGGDGSNVKPVEVEAIAPVESKLATSTVKSSMRWTFEIEDETKIPRKYLIPDTVAIGRAVRSEGVREIAGVSIFPVSYTHLTLPTN